MRFNFFSKPPVNLGALYTDGDVISQKELFTSYAPTDYAEKPRDKWRKFLQQYQYKSSACVAFTMAKIAMILFSMRNGSIARFSPGFWYIDRSNKPAEGMNFFDAQNLSSRGALPYELMPSENLNEIQINSLTMDWYHRECARPFALPDRWIDIPLDFDKVASTILKTKKGIMLWFEFGDNEWFGRETPVKLGDIKYRHSVTAVDAFSFNGQNYILIEDSADKSKWQKLISRDFFSRCFLARYPMNFVYSLKNEKPVYDGSIASLQYCLEYEGFFPSNISKVENIGKVTQEALKKFQAKYGIIITGTLTLSTENKINDLYKRS